MVVSERQRWCWNTSGLSFPLDSVSFTCVVFCFPISSCLELYPSTRLFLRVCVHACVLFCVSFGTSVSLSVSSLFWGVCPSACLSESLHAHRHRVSPRESKGKCTCTTCIVFVDSSSFCGCVNGRIQNAFSREENLSFDERVEYLRRSITTLQKDIAEVDGGNVARLIDLHSVRCFWKFSRIPFFFLIFYCSRWYANEGMLSVVKTDLKGFWCSCSCSWTSQLALLQKTAMQRLCVTDSAEFLLEADEVCS